MSDLRDHSLKQTGLLALLTLTGLGLRLLHLGSQSYWLDEAISLGIARNDLATILTNVVQSSHPPLYYLLLKGWLARGLGGDETTVRILSALLSTAAILAVYVLAPVLFDTHTALASAGLMAISPFQVLYAQEARMYGLLSLLMTLTLLAFVHPWRTNRLRNWLLFAVVATSCAYTHYFGLLVSAGVGLFTAAEDLASRTWRRWPGLGLAGPWWPCCLYPNWVYSWTKPPTPWALGRWRPIHSTFPHPSILCCSATPYRAGWWR